MGDVGVDYEEDLVMSQWLLSGAVGAVLGALVATVLSVAYQYMAERMKLKADATIFVVQWMQSIKQCFWKTGHWRKCDHLVFV